MRAVAEPVGKFAATAVEAAAGLGARTLAPPLTGNAAGEVVRYVLSVEAEYLVDS